MINKKTNLNSDLKSSLILFGPGFAFYLVFMMVPILMSLYYSFFNWNGIKLNYSFIGLSNFIEVVQDQEVLHSILVTFWYAVPGTVIVNVLGILFAVLVNKKNLLTNIYRSVFFFPLLISPVVVGFIWKALLNYNGIVNQLLALIHMTPIDFLGNPDIAPFSIMLTNIWRDTGFVTVLYLAGLQAISKDLYDAAWIDGANGWQQFFNITFPWLAPSFTSCVILMFTGYMRLYDIVVVLTNGGPAGATETIAMQVIKVAFNQNRFSYGSAIAIYMLCIVSVFSITLTRFLRKREENLL